MSESHDVNNIYHLIYDRDKSDCKRSGGGGVDGSGGPPHDSDMERRVADLETKVDGIKDTLSAIQTTLATIQATAATKDDVHKLALDMAYVKGRVEMIPTFPKIAALGSILTAISALVAFAYHIGTTHSWW